MNRFLRKTHHFVKSVPGLKWFDALAVRVWFKLPVVRWVYQVVLLLKLAVKAIRKQRRLVVFCRFGGIGDIICSFPAVHEFIRRNPNSEVVYVTLTAFCEVIRRSGLPISYTTIGKHVVPPRWASLIVEKCIMLEYANEVTHSKLPPVHLIDDFARTLGFGHLTEEPSLIIDSTNVKNIRSNFIKVGTHQLVLLHAGPTWRVREWPQEYWTQLVERLKKHGDVEVLQIVAARNVTLKDAFCPIIPGTVSVQCVNDVGRLIETIAAVDLLIAIDSGPVHIAAAVGTNCVGIFGPTDPDLRLWRRERAEAVYYKLNCSFCHHRHPPLHWQTGCPYNIACMQNVTVDQVFKSACRFLPLRIDNEVML
jgi:ADP-heptose:LPS heptosyltransferase